MEVTIMLALCDVYKEYMNFKPLFKPDRVVFYREEKSGLLYLMVKDSFIQDIIINRTTNFILSLCDGLKSINDICVILMKKYNRVSEDTLKNDIINSLYHCHCIGILNWKGGSPFMGDYSKNINSKWLYLAQEDDIRNIKMILSDKEKCNFSYINCLRNWDYYDIVAIRASMFKFVEDFFIIYSSEKKIVEGIISVIAPDELRGSCQVGVMLGKGLNITPYLREIISSYPQIINKKINKFKIPVCDKESYKSLLDDSGLQLENIAKRELIDGRDILTYSHFYNEEALS